MLEEQRKKLEQARLFVQQREKKEKSLSFKIKRFFGLVKSYHDGDDNAPKRTVPISDEWLNYMIDKMIEIFPVEYEEECLKALELGIKPRKGLILHRVCIQ